MLDKVVAGRVAGRYFFLESKISLLLTAALLLIDRAINRHEASEILHGAPPQSRVGFNLLLLMATLASVVVGYEVLHPMMESARQGQGGWTFLQLHGLSMALYGIRTLLVLALAWRCAGNGADRQAKPSASQD